MSRFSGLPQSKSLPGSRFYQLAERLAEPLDEGATVEAVAMRPAPSTRPTAAKASAPAPLTATEREALERHRIRKATGAPCQPRLTDAERKRIAAEVTAELAVEAKQKRQAEASALWDRVIARAFGPEGPAGTTTIADAAACPAGSTTINEASAAWDAAYSRMFPNQPVA